MAFVSLVLLTLLYSLLRSVHSLPAFDSSAKTDLNVDTYHSHNELLAWMRDLAANNPNLTEVIPLGQTFEDRDILAFRIGKHVSTSSDSTRTRSHPRPAIWIDAGIHGNEWLTVATATWLIWRLIGLANVADENQRLLVQSVDWYVNPVFNPDGYEYSRYSERMWRKTRTKPPWSSCVGADPDRNWDIEWGTVGSSTEPCSDIYAGDAAFSEPCVEASRQGIASVNAGGSSQVQVYLALHSYGQLWMYPYAYTNNPCDDCEHLREVADAAVSHLTSLYNTRYIVGPTSQLLYPFSGSSADYVHSVLGVPYSYYVELRDEGRYGFIIPPSFINSTGEETWRALQYLAGLVLTEQQADARD